MISFQNKVLKGHAEKLKEKLNYALKEANDEKLAHKENRYQLIYLQEHTDKPILKPSTLERYTRLIMQLLIEEHD